MKTFKEFLEDKKLLEAEVTGDIAKTELPVKSKVEKRNPDDEETCETEVKKDNGITKI